MKEFGGEHILAAPVDKGFNRLAWLFPYLLGVTAAASVGLAAFRWSRRDGVATAAHGRLAAAGDPELSARLDDELRDLD